MATSDRKQVSLSDTQWEKIPVVEGARGYIKLKIQKGRGVKVLETSWFNFYIEKGRTIIEAFFGDNNGVDNVPAVALWAYRPPLVVDSYVIDRPPENIAGLFGTGRPGHVGAAGWGKGTLDVHDTSSEREHQFIEGSFNFEFKDYDDEMVTVAAEKFWAMYSSPSYSYKEGPAIYIEPTHE